MKQYLILWTPYSQSINLPVETIVGQHNYITTTDC